MDNSPGSANIDPAWLPTRDVDPSDAAGDATPAGDLPGPSAAVDHGPVHLWEQALSALSGKVSAHNFELWFRPVRCVRIADATIHLQAPNTFIQEWFATHYLRIVLDEVRRAAARALPPDAAAVPDYRVTWQLEDGASPEAADSAPASHGPARSGRRPAASRAPAKADPAPRPGRADRPAPAAAAPPAAAAVPPPAAAPSEARVPPGREGGSDLLPKYTFASFVVGPSNQLAEAASRAVAENPAGKYNPLFIYGGVGLGKTHLLHAIGSQIQQRHPTWRIVYLKTETFMNEYIHQVRNGRIDEFRAKYRDSTDVLLMDDIQYLGGKERTQDEFFHTFNALFESHRQIVVTADKYPHEIPDLEDRIRSRFQWGLIADIQAPELETRIAILEKKALGDGIDLPSEVAYFLAANIKSNVRELEGLLIRVAAFASLRQQPITVDFVRETLKSFLTQATAQLTVESVQREVANYFGVSVVDLRSQSRQASVARPRQIAMYLARKLCKASYPDLGQRFGGKDHTTVMSACRRIESLLDSDPKVRGAVEEIEKHLLV